MLIAILQALFERDLLKLKTEIELYHDEKNYGTLKKASAIQPVIFVCT
jgi:hypothetical protein